MLFGSTISVIICGRVMYAYKQSVVVFQRISTNFKFNCVRVVRNCLSALWQVDVSSKRFTAGIFMNFSNTNCPYRCTEPTICFIYELFRGVCLK